MLLIGEHDVVLEDFRQILFGNRKIEIDPLSLERVRNSYNFLESFYADKIIYGINTGLGPMAQYRIADADRVALQYNAIRSHASGMGEPVNPEYVRSAMVVLLNNFLRGNSGIHPEVPELLCSMINHKITPVVPEHGGVGASGDLVQLAHIGLALIGEGYVHHNGETISTAGAFAKYDLRPVSVHIREGLSIINGTCFMTGIGIINLIHARNLLSWSVSAGTIINELMHSCDDSFSKELNRVKKHPGQNAIAELMRITLADSKLIRNREEQFYKNNHGNKHKLDDKVQEYYSIRCLPQILGPVLETIDNAEMVLINEANSSCDNPVVDPANNNIYHGGNFHGDYVSLEMDKIKMCITKLSLIAERQINYLMNEKLNNMLPPFVNLGQLGVNFGMQGAQFTATSTASENQTLSFPSYVHTIPNNNDNQDIVSMGTNSALMAKRVIDNTFQVLSIEMLSLVQAIDYLDVKNQLSSSNRKIYDQIREKVGRFESDTIKYVELKKIKDYLCSRFFDDMV
ncbi:MAG TPA: aromatic amino acid ammonia-lyase [Bacteroidales bacterium]|nr:aromatic amino acid ammonia-lyase [Bacteroidales bacterium]HPF02524.1 aromatic amino acid ammonia-lyase [Bacteroidales bacterium]HPJ58367.1 aromatic amino acid ammonia-lyase [Bacteroidales bacterium]HPR10827.1 aromatic amino acid ammonia-lyase [Bacteroidales bacterium]HRW84213.1 aromatic amino acid ammonia-lyase [Bacteroidales bacterium]